MDVGQERLAARGHPLDRPSERERQRDGGEVVLVDVDLDAERAADIGRDHAHALLGQVEQVGQHGLHHVRHLGRHPHREAARGRLEVGHEAARLDRHAGVTARGERAPPHARGGAERARGVAAGQARLVDDVVAEIGMDERRVRGDRRRGREQRRQRTIADAHQGHGVRGRGARLGGDGDDRLAGVADALDRQRQHRAALHALVVLQDAAARLAEAAGLVAGQHGGHAGGAARGVDVERGERGVGVLAADEGHVDQARQHKVVDVAPAAGEDPRIVRSPDRRAYLRHARQSSTIDSARIRPYDPHTYRSRRPSCNVARF